jgi:hypothetical protein
VQKVEESIGLRKPQTVEERIAEANVVPTAEQNDAAMAQLQSMLGGIKL